jgi:hypothetical protein
VCIFVHGGTWLDGLFLSSRGNGGGGGWLLFFGLVVVMVVVCRCLWTRRTGRVPSPHDLAPQSRSVGRRGSRLLTGRWL